MASLTAYVISKGLNGLGGEDNLTGEGLKRYDMFDLGQRCLNVAKTTLRDVFVYNCRNSTI